MLLADADVEEPRRELLEQRRQPGAGRHGGGDRDGRGLPAHRLRDRIGEDLRVLRRDRRRAAGRRHAVPLLVVRFGRPVPVALLRVDVHEDRPIAEVAGLPQHAFDRFEVVAVHRAEVREAELLEQDVRDEDRLQRREQPAPSFLGEVARGHVLEDCPRDVFQLAIRRRGADGLEHPRDRADVRRDAHPVVVEDDDDPCPARADVVDRFPGHARGQRAVADDRDDVLVPALQVARDRHALRGGDRGAGVAGAELVVLGLGPREEPRDAAELAQGPEAIAPSGEELVDVPLVAGIPHELVARRVEDAMERHGELRRTEARADVPAGLLHGIDRELADLAAELRELCPVERAEVGGALDPVEEGHP